MRRSIRIFIAVLTILVGGVAVYWAELYEQERRLACVQVITPTQFISQGVTIGKAGQSACFLSPALRTLTDSAGAMLIRLAPQEPSQGPQWIEWLPVDSVRWVVINQYKPGQSKFAVSLQIQALAKTIRHRGLKRVVVLVPEEHRQPWLHALGQSLVLEVCPSP